MTEEQRKQIIEERANHIKHEAFKKDVYVFDYVTEEEFISFATEQLDWFRSHGLDIPEKYVEAKILGNPFDRYDGLASNANYYGWEMCIDVVKEANPNGLYTKEVSHD